MSPRTLVVPVGLNVPVSVGIARVVVLGAGNFDLLETPLGKVGIASSEVAAQDLMLQSESSSKSSDAASVTRGSVTNDLNLPVILLITDSQVAVR